MAYSRNIKNHARDFCARDISCAKIVKLLQETHPIDCVNMNRSTIERWRDQENWDDFAKRVRQNYEEKHVAKVVDQLRKEELEDLQALKDVQAHIVSRLSEGIKDGEVVCALPPQELSVLARALDCILRRKRINQYGFDVVNNLELIVSRNPVTV